MADWTWETTDGMTAETWAKRFWIEAMTESFFQSKGLIGPNENNDIIVSFNDLEREQGYQHSFGQIRELSGAGVSGDSIMEGNEEEPDIFDSQVTLAQKRNAIRTKGKLSDQYPSDKSVRKWAKELLKRWKAEMIDQQIFDDLSTSLTKTIWGGDATATASIEAGDYMTLNLIAKAVAYSDKATPMIMGKMKGGERTRVCVMSPDQAFDLRERDAAWAQAQREATMRSEKNRVFTDAMGMWQSTALYKHKRVPIATTWGGGGATDGATALFLGVSAGAIAWAKKSIWNEKTFDYGNKVGFCIGAIWGSAKAVFNSADNAVVGLGTYRTDN